MDKRKPVTKYNHHGNDVAVFVGYKGKHRDHCLCWQCGKFYPEPENMHQNCLIARMLYNLNVLLKLVTPVWECHDYILPRPDQVGEGE